MFTQPGATPRAAALKAGQDLSSVTEFDRLIAWVDDGSYFDTH